MKRVLFFKGFFQPAYTATLFTAYLIICCRMLDQNFLSLNILALSWFGVFSAQILDNLGIWSPEDLINQPDRILILNQWRSFLFPLAVCLFALSAILLFSVMINKILYFKIVVWVGVIFIFYTYETFNGLRLKKIRYLKSLVVSMGWILLALAIDFGMNRDHFFIRPKGIIFILSSLVLLISDTLLLDFRDRKGDRHFGIWSFPKSWDSKLALIVSGLNLVCVLIIFFLKNHNSMVEQFAHVLLTAHFTLAFSALIVPFISNRANYLFWVSLWIPLATTILIIG